MNAPTFKKAYSPTPKEVTSYVMEVAIQHPPKVLKEPKGEDDRKKVVATTTSPTTQKPPM